MSVVFKVFIIYSISCISVVVSFWWSAPESTTTTTTTTTETPIFHGVTSEEFYFQDKILQHQFIVPGTKYCGRGNKSSDPDDLGRFKKVDICCRDHDNCPDNIPAGKYKYGLHNNAKFTKSHCTCDETFHRCLKNVGTPPARLVGALYFTIFHINCFKKDYPVIDCTIHKYRRCLEYQLDFSATPVYQWFDNPFFRHWIDQFPQHLAMNTTATTPMNLINMTDYIELNLTQPDSEIENITHIISENMTLQTNSSISYFGGYFQSFYETLTKYLYNWTLTRTEIEMTTIKYNYSGMNELDYDINSEIDFYVLN